MACDQYALEASEYAALDDLSKPFDDDWFDRPSNEESNQRGVGNVLFVYFSLG